MFTNITAFLIFALVTNITPGPNNITSLSFSLNQGYKKTVPYMCGISNGVFLVLLLIATLLYFFSSTSLAVFMGYLRYVGAAYILYLAYKTFKMNVNWSSDTKIRSYYLDGLLLQSVNPKSYFFATTIFTSFINFQCVEYWQLALLSLILSINTFLATSIWGGVGVALKNLLTKPLYTQILGAIMSLGLIYTAYTIFVS